MLEDFKDLRIALEKKIKNCSSVFIVGHDGPDFDSFGAAIGLSAIARNFNKKAYIIIDDEPTKIESGVKKLECFIILLTIARMLNKLLFPEAFAPYIAVVFRILRPFTST